MANKKTLTKPQKSQKKSTPKKLKIGGMTFTEYSPANEMANNPQLVALAMAEALLDGDKEAFQEILSGFISALNITHTAKAAKISRTIIYEAMDKTKNPSLESLCKIMKAFKGAEPKSKAA